MLGAEDGEVIVLLRLGKGDSGSSPDEDVEAEVVALLGPLVVLFVQDRADQSGLTPAEAEEEYYRHNHAVEQPLPAQLTV